MHFLKSFCPHLTMGCGSLPEKKEAAMTQIEAFLKTVKVARKQIHQNLTLFPLLAPEGDKPDYSVLEEALEKGQVEVTERDREGSVPELKLLNKGNKPVLVVEGEELIGAKQNRIVNVSFLVAGKTGVVIPVSCVEQGRWRYDSVQFASGKKMMHASLRRVSQQDVAYSIQRGEGYRSDQGRIWDDIQEKSVRMEAPSPTGAMAEIYDSYDERLTEFTQAFQLIEWQVGAIFAIDGQVLGLECFGCYDTFTLFFEKLVKSYALDALDRFEKVKTDSVPPEKARRFIKSAMKSNGEDHPSLGQGANMTFESRTVSGAALVEGNRLLDLSAFRKEKKNSVSGIGFLRYSRRRSLR